MSNPRNIKRFINSLVLSYGTSGKNILSIDNENLRNYSINSYLWGIIAIQTFYFRGEKWLQFFRMIMNYDVRINFLTQFVRQISENFKYKDLRDKIRDFPLETLKFIIS